MWSLQTPYCLQLASIHAVEQEAVSTTSANSTIPVDIITEASSSGKTACSTNAVNLATNAKRVTISAMKLMPPLQARRHQRKQQAHWRQEQQRVKSEKRTRRG